MTYFNWVSEKNDSSLSWKDWVSAFRWLISTSALSAYCPLIFGCRHHQQLPFYSVESQLCSAISSMWSTSQSSFGGTRPGSISNRSVRASPSASSHFATSSHLLQPGKTGCMTSACSRREVSFRESVMRVMLLLEPVEDELLLVELPVPGHRPKSGELGFTWRLLRSAKEGLRPRAPNARR